MYIDFRNYINSTFFEVMTTNLLQNDTNSFCPDSIGSSASLFTIPTTYFNGGKEYFGLHDVLFSPGVAQSLNGTC